VTAARRAVPLVLALVVTVAVVVLVTATMIAACGACIEP